MHVNMYLYNLNEMTTKTISVHSFNAADVCKPVQKLPNISLSRFSSLIHLANARIVAVVET